MFTYEMKTAAKIMRERKPETMDGIYQCALVEANDNQSLAEEIVNAHYQNLSNQDYRAVAGMKPLEENQ